MSKRHVSHLLAMTLLAPTLVACGDSGGSAGDDPIPVASGVDFSPGTPDAGGAAAPPPVDSFIPLDPPVSDGAPVPSCPQLDGEWTGTLQGNVSGFFKLTVSGTVSLTLSPQGAPGDYVVASGQLVAAAKGLELFPLKAAVGGNVTCGALTATQTLNVFGVTATGSVSCTLTEQGCQGTWDGQTADGASSGTGTFELHRK